MSMFLSNWFGIISLYWYFKLWCNFFIFFRIGRTIVCTNFGQEVFLFQRLAIASKESLLKDFPQEWLHWIEVELACERKATNSTWYNAPAVLLAMLVWKVSKSYLMFNNSYTKSLSCGNLWLSFDFIRKSLMQL